MANAAPAVANAGACDADGKVRLAGSGSADQHKITLMVEKVSGRQIADQGLVDLGGLEVELLEFLGQWQLGDGHLIFDRARLLLTDLGGQQVTNDPLGFMLALDRRGDDLVVGRPHAVELQLPRVCRRA